MRRRPRRAEVDPQHPQGWATSDRNGHIGNLHNMKWQMEWRGSAVVNTRVLVHEDELDIPQRQLGTLVIPPDPPPLFNARPENYDIDEQPVSTRYTIGPDGYASLIRIIINNEPYYSNRIVSGPGGVVHSGVISSSGGTVSGPAFVGTTFDASTATHVDLSNGNLTATNNANSNAPPMQGVKVGTSAGKTSGKYYYEIEWTAETSFDSGFGVCITLATYTNLAQDGTGGIVCYRSGNIFNGSNTGFNIGGITVGDKIGIAVNVGSGKVWFTPVFGVEVGSFSWNGVSVGDPSQNPSTGAGGVTITAGTIVPYCVFGGFPGDLLGNAITANFGATAFSGTVPTGFTSGWPA